MNIVDVLIILLLIAGIVRGASSGLMRQGLSLVGFFAGLALGSVVAQWIVPHIGDPSVRAIGGIGITLGAGFVLAAVGEMLGWRLRGLAHAKRVGEVDNILGAVFEAVAVILSVWLLAALIARLPAPGLNQEIGRAHV